MKVMMLASGKSYHATRWANALVERGIGIIFVSVHALVRPLDDRVIHVDLGGNGRIAYLTSLNRLRHLIKQHAPDLVHSHSAGGYALMGAFGGRHPWIVSVYGADVYDVPGKSPLHHFVVEQMLKRADRLLSTSHAMARQVAKEFPSLPLATVTPFGVDTERFRHRRIGVDSHARRIGVVKKLEWKYGIDILIAAFSILVKRCSYPVELHIVGDGSKRSELEEQCLTSGMADQIHFHGAIPNNEVPEFLAGLDIFVVPSRLESESFGVAAVEAMSASLPVIVSDVGGLPEVVEDGVSGIVVKREDSEVLAVAMEQLIRNPTWRRKLGWSARIRVECEYDWSTNVDQMVRIYKETTLC